MSYKNIILILIYITKFYSSTFIFYFIFGYKLFDTYNLKLFFFTTIIFTLIIYIIFSSIVYVYSDIPYMPWNPLFLGHYIILLFCLFFWFSIIFYMPLFYKFFLVLFSCFYQFIIILLVRRWRGFSFYKWFFSSNSF